MAGSLSIGTIASWYFPRRHADHHHPGSFCRTGWGSTSPTRARVPATPAIRVLPGRTRLKPSVGKPHALTPEDSAPADHHPLECRSDTQSESARHPRPPAERTRHGLHRPAGGHGTDHSETSVSMVESGACPTLPHRSATNGSPYTWNCPGKPVACAHRR